jgi:tetratricopeptide (TPR) repeat protein
MPRDIVFGLLPPAALVAITFITYSNSLHGAFVFDDQTIIFQNPQLINIRTFQDLLGLAGSWRQLLFLSYGLNYYWSGLDTYSYHLVNVLLHCLNTVLIYFIILEIQRPLSARFVAFSGAALFGVHTLFSGAVSYIAGRSSILCALLYFLALLLVLKGMNNNLRLRFRLVCWIMSAVSGFLAWQAKQEAITLPAFVAVLMWMRLDRKYLKYAAVAAGLPLILALSMRRQLEVLFTTVTENEVLVNAGFEPVLGPAAYIRTYITSVVGYYFPRFVIPVNLSADPHILPVENWYSPEFLFSIVVLICLAWMIVNRRLDPLLIIGVSAILVSPLTAYTFVPLADVVLEHRAYIPGLGIALVGAALFRSVERHFRSIRFVATAVVVVVLMVMTLNRNTVFANNVALWEDAVRKSPGKPRAHFNLGAAYHTAQRPGDAIREYRAALKLKPDIHAAYSNLAAIQLDQGRLREGEATLLEVTRIAPSYTEGFINLAVLYLRTQEVDKALNAVNRAIEISSDSFAAHFNKGEALTLKGDLASAVESYQRAVYLRPDLAPFRLSLGLAHVRAGNRAEAEREFTSLSRTELAGEAFRGLASLYAEADTDKAIAFLERAIQTKPAYPDAHHDLGVIYLQKQKVADAIREFQATLGQKPDHGPAVLNLALAFQMAGNKTSAARTLRQYADQYGSSGAPYVEQAKQRLEQINGTATIQR